MNTLEKIAQLILNGQMGAMADQVREALNEGLLPQVIIDQGLIAGMSQVGVLFKADEMYLPEVIVSAKTMHNGMDVLRPLLEKTEAGSAVKVVLGTVQGDVHDIGKNLVGMMMTGAGYSVVDLGVDQPSDQFVQAVREEKPSVVALSALLTTTMPQMRTVIETLESEDLRDKVKVIVGGAPVSENFAREIRADGYASDAASAIDKLKEILP